MKIMNNFYLHEKDNRGVMELSLIPCNSECSHQKEGYCMLEKPDSISNFDHNEGCPHYIDREEKES